MNSEIPEAWFMDAKRTIEKAYLRTGDPIRQSGFGGGPERWRSERGPILDAIDRDGDILDVGCANGYLLECLIAWAGESGRALVPYGVDISEKLIELARARMTEKASHFWVANAWRWTPPRRFRYVYALLDSVPIEFMGAYAVRLLDRYVEASGRLIAGHYGSRHRREAPLDAAAILESVGMRVEGVAQGGEPAITRFAWADKR